MASNQSKPNPTKLIWTDPNQMGMISGFKKLRAIKKWMITKNIPFINWFGLVGFMAYQPL